MEDEPSKTKPPVSRLQAGGFVFGGPSLAKPFRTWRLHVIFPSDKQVVVMWNRNDPVSHVKQYLEVKYGIPREQQVLQWVGAAKPLVNERKLVEYNLGDEAVVRLSVNLVACSKQEQSCYFDDMTDETGFIVWIKTVGLQNLAVEVTPKGTVMFLKERARVWTGVPTHQQHLIFGTELEDDHTLGSYGMQPGAMINMAVDDRD